jgi:hypothetical protein
MIITIFIQGISNYTSEPNKQTNHAPKLYTVPLLSNCSGSACFTVVVAVKLPVFMVLSVPLSVAMQSAFYCEAVQAWARLRTAFWICSLLGR